MPHTKDTKCRSTKVIVRTILQHRNIVIVPRHYASVHCLSLVEDHCYVKSRTTNSITLDSFWLVIAHIPSYNSTLSSSMLPITTTSRLESYHPMRQGYKCEIILFTGYIAWNCIFSRWFRFRFPLWVSFMSLDLQSFSLSTLLLLVVVPNINFDRHLQSQSLFNLCIHSSFPSVNLLETLALFTMVSDLLWKAMSHI